MKSEILFATVALFLGGCSAPSEQGPTPASSTATNLAQTATLPRVQVAAPMTGTIAKTVKITGTLEPNRQVEIHAMEGGQVLEVAPEIGDRVDRDQLLLTLANPALTQLSVEANAKSAAAEAGWTRLAAAFQLSPGLTSRDALDRAEAAHYSAAARAEALAARVGLLEIRAPFAGRITARYVDEGALVGSGLEGGGAVLELQEDQSLRLVVPLPEVDAVGISRGTPVSIMFPGVGGEAVSATVSRTAGSLGSASRSMRVEIDLPNASGSLMPGQYARVSFAAERTADVWLLPVASRVMHDDRPTVMLVAPDGTVGRRPIIEGRSNASYFEVLGSGWSADDRVITGGKSLVRPGDRVEAVLAPTQQAAD